MQSVSGMMVLVLNGTSWRWKIPSCNWLLNDASCSLKIKRKGYLYLEPQYPLETETINDVTMLVRSKKYGDISSSFSKCGVPGDETHISGATEKIGK